MRFNSISSVNIFTWFFSITVVKGVMIQLKKEKSGFVFGANTEMPNDG